MRGELDNEWHFLDGPCIKAHQLATGIEKPEEKTIGISKGAKPTKIHVLADTHGNPIDFKLTPGNIYDVTVGDQFINISEGENIIAGKGYDAEYLREAILAKGATPYITRKSNSTKENNASDKDLYKRQHLVENLFAKLKHFRAFATRFNKLTRNFESVVYIRSS